MFTHRDVRRERIRMLSIEALTFFPVAVGYTLTRFWALEILCLLFFGVMILTVYFFRDPERIPPKDGRLILAPADGRIVEITETVYPGTNRPARKIAIFLSVFNVHVNRIPFSGSIQRWDYHTGSFLPAYKPEASTKNEQTEIHIATEHGDVVVRQIAGILARRIVCRLAPQEKVRAGDRFGLIRFGSRTEIYFPADFRIRVAPGDRVYGGLTPIGELER
jgi:phosphatidylserine decarboxylase